MTDNAAPRASRRALALVDEIVSMARLEGASSELADNPRVRAYCETWIGHPAEILRAYLRGEITDAEIEYRLGQDPLALAARRPTREDADRHSARYLRSVQRTGAHD